ncbi:MAG: hypothetical protein V4687_14960 [Bacteroidota bacterium]
MNKTEKYGVTNFLIAFAYPSDALYMAYTHKGVIKVFHTTLEGV